MCTYLEQHANKIAAKLAGSKEEIDDVRDEFISHLQASKEDFTNEGYSEDEAEKMAVSHFGIPDKIADEMHEAMFPHRKLLFLILAIISLLAAFSVYFASLFINNDAYYGSLITAVVTSIAFLILSSGRFPKWEKVRFIVALLFIHILIFANLAMIAADIMSDIKFLLNILVYTIPLFALILIYYIVLSANSRGKKVLLFIHAANITLGIIYITFSLFMLWASLLFSGELSFISLIAFIPAFLWMIAYIFQIKAINHEKNKTAFSILTFSCLMGISFFGLLYG